MYPSIVHRNIKNNIFNVSSLLLFYIYLPLSWGSNQNKQLIKNTDSPETTLSSLVKKNITQYFTIFSVSFRHTWDEVRKRGTCVSAVAVVKPFRLVVARDHSSGWGGVATYRRFTKFTVCDSRVPSTPK